MVTVQFGVTGHRAFNLTLERFQMNAQDASPALDRMADHQRGVWVKQFNSEGSYSGDRWQALSPAYAAWKAKRYPGKPILQRTGDMMAGFTQRPFAVEVIENDFMVIGSADPKAKFHQHGGGRLPQRKIVTRTRPADAKVFAKILQEWIVKGTV